MIAKLCHNSKRYRKLPICFAADIDKKINHKKQPYNMLCLPRKGKEKKFTAILDKEFTLTFL
jgi:hypothetical protein